MEARRSFGVAPTSRAKRPALDLPDLMEPLDVGDGDGHVDKADAGGFAPRPHDGVAGRTFTSRDHSPPPSSWYPHVAEMLSEVSAIVERQDVSLMMDAGDLFVCPHHAGGGDAGDAVGATGGAADAVGGGEPPRSPLPDESDLRRLLTNEHLRMSHAPDADGAADDDDDAVAPAARPVGTARGRAASSGDIVVISPELEPPGGAPREAGGAPFPADRRRTAQRPVWRHVAVPVAAAPSAPSAAGAAAPPSAARRPAARRRQREAGVRPRRVGDLPTPLDRSRPSGDTQSAPSSPPGGGLDRRVGVSLPPEALTAALDDAVGGGGAVAKGAAAATAAAAAAEPEMSVVRARALPSRRSFVIPRPPSTLPQRRMASPYAGVPPGLVEKLGKDGAGAAYYRLVWPGHTLTCADACGQAITQTASLSAQVVVNAAPTRDGRDAVVTLQVRALYFAVDGQVIEQTSHGSTLGYYVDRVRMTAVANNPSTLVLDATWPRAGAKVFEVQHEVGSSTNVEIGATGGVEGPTPLASLSATRGRGTSTAETSTMERPNWTWSSAAVAEVPGAASSAVWTWDMSTWADGSLYANDVVSLRGDAWPRLHPELRGEATIGPAADGVRARWRVHRRQGRDASAPAPWGAAPGWDTDASGRWVAVAGGDAAAGTLPPPAPPSPPAWPAHVSLTVAMEPRLRLRRRAKRRLLRPFVNNRTLVQEWPPRSDPADARAQFLLRVDLPPPPPV